MGYVSENKPPNAFLTMKQTLLLLAGCLALTAALAQRPNPDDRFDTDLSEQEMRSLSIPDPFDERAVRYGDTYAARGPQPYGPSVYGYNQPPRLNGRERRAYRQGFDDGYRMGYRDGFRNLPGRRLRRPDNPIELGFAEGYNRGIRAGQAERYSRYGNRYDDRYGRRDGYPNYPRRY
jgi:hypothetical protein